MNSHRNKSTVIALVTALGILAPFVWVWLLVFTAPHIWEPILQWLWSTFSIKGIAATTLVSALESVVFGALFAAVLRIVAGRSWVLASITFSLAFIVAFYIPAFVQDPSYALLAIPLSFASVAGVLVLVVAFLVAFSHLPRHERA